MFGTADLDLETELSVTRYFVQTTKSFFLLMQCRYFKLHSAKRFAEKHN